MEELSYYSTNLNLNFSKDEINIKSMFISYDSSFNSFEVIGFVF